MADLALINQELADLRSERDELRAKHAGATMPEAAKARDVEIMDRVKRLVFVAEEEQQKKRDNEANELARFMDDPHYQIKHPVNDDADGIKTLNRAGWELKAGMVTRQTSIGEIAMYPEEVLHGPVRDQASAQYINQVRRTFQPDYRQAYVNYLRNVGLSGGDAVAARQMLTSEERNALQEGTESQGGALVPPDIQAEILARVAQNSVMRRLCRIVNTTRDQIRFPAVTAHSTSGSLYSSGFVGTWAAETPVFTDTDPSFETFEIAIKKIRVGTKMSNDFLADAGSNVLAFLAQNGA